MRPPLLPPSRSRAPRRLLPAAATAVVLLLAGCGEEEEAAVATAAVQTGAVREVVEAPGTVQPRASSTVTAPATGTVATLEVTDGQQVQAGQVLATIDSPQAHDALEQAREADRRAAAAGSSSSSSADPDEVAAQQRRARADARARFEQAEQQAAALPDAVAREAALAAVRSSRTQYELLAAQTQALVEQVAAGLGDVDAAVAALGQAQRVQTRAAVAAAQATVDALTVRAPITGTVSLAGTGSAGTALPAGAAALLQSGALPESALAGAAAGQDLGAAGAPGSPVLAAGAAVNAGAPLLSVIDASVLTLTADVDESDVLRVQPGQVAEVAVDAVEGATYRGTVTGVDPSATGTGGAVTYTVRLSYDGGTADSGGEAPTPLPGMSAVVSLVVAEAADAVRVPAAAVVRGGAGTAAEGADAPGDAVWVVRDGVAERRDVTVGVRGQQAVQVTEGLRAGERIVTEGAADVRAGQQLP
ncbi:efflux RND transporter periplasmic adaptor subunit [Kineococcus sp. G2]|uniref:efflux RND transporter periplasmic adaptor subunit n=1 Tax=Kineococcus sp. G2 TaxID=3127484 RepID=UPI00301BDE6C